MQGAQGVAKLLERYSATCCVCDEKYDAQRSVTGDVCAFTNASLHRATEGGGGEDLVPLVRVCFDGCTVCLDCLPLFLKQLADKCATAALTTADVPMYARTPSAEDAREALLDCPFCSESLSVHADLLLYVRPTGPVPAVADLVQQLQQGRKACREAVPMELSPGSYTALVRLLACMWRAAPLFVCAGDDCGFSTLLQTDVRPRPPLPAFMDCPRCATPTCMRCAGEAHRRGDCDEAARARRVKTAAIALPLKPLAIACVECGLHMAHSRTADRCHHLRCPRCSTEQCYVCRKAKPANGTWCRCPIFCAQDCPHCLPDGEEGAGAEGAGAEGAEGAEGAGAEGAGAEGAGAEGAGAEGAGAEGAGAEGAGAEGAEG